MLDEKQLHEIFKCRIFSDRTVVIEGIRKEQEIRLTLIEENNNVVFILCKAGCDELLQYNKGFSESEEFKETLVFPIEWFKIPERFQSLRVDIENKNLYIGPGRNVILKGVYHKVFEPEQEGIGPFYNCITAEPYKEDRENLVLFYSHTKGDYRAFSNFYPSEIEIDGKTYQTVEHYFQACKATDEEDHEKVRLAGNPYKTKELGKSIRRRDDWEDIKFGIMKKGCYAKFTRYKDLMKLLLSTGDLAIHENTLNDLEWGWFDNKGKDKLGRILTEVREEIRKNADTGAIYIEDKQIKERMVQNRRSHNKGTRRED